MFGQALHTATDELSPEHSGFQPWYVMSSVGGLLRAWKHHQDEQYSATSDDPDSELARDEAQYEAGILWDQFNARLQSARHPKTRRQHRSNEAVSLGEPHEPN